MLFWFFPSVLPVEWKCYITVHLPCLRVPKTTPRFDDSQEVREDSLDSVYRTHDYDLYVGEYKAKSAKWRRTWDTIWRKPGTDLQSLLPVESHGTHFIPSATSCIMIMHGKYPLPGKLFGD